MSDWTYSEPERFVGLPSGAWVRASAVDVVALTTTVVNGNDWQEVRIITRGGAKVFAGSKDADQIVRLIAGVPSTSGEPE